MVPVMTLAASDRPTLQLLPGRDQRPRQGHPWIYSNELRMDEAARALPAGSLVRLAAAGGACLGTALFNPHTLIAGRLLSPDGAIKVDRGYFGTRLHRALELRRRLVDRPYYRLIHAEADGLPGLIIDRFGDVVVVQANCAGMDRLLPELLPALADALHPRAVVLRHDSSVRAMEGLPSEVTLAAGSLDGPVRLEENGAEFFADPLAGQKTGWFYDQRDNRAFAARLAGGARVLDLYTYHGGFAVQAACGGADSVLAIDRSQTALDWAQRAAELNGMAERCSFRRGEAFAELEQMATAGERFDLVIADPPAFVKARKDLGAGSRAYRKLAKLSARVTGRGGFLLAASCSHHVDAPAFAEQVTRGIADAGRNGRILRQAGAAPDHPVHPMLPETAYLKAMVLQLD
jgi:23S rRNA (cytosine1962-C5)-methyltransferase